MDNIIYQIPDDMDTGKEEHVYKNPNSEKIEQVNKSCGKPKFDVIKLVKLALLYGAVVVGLVGFSMAIVSFSEQGSSSAKLDELATEMNGLKQAVAQMEATELRARVGGAVYIRWGRTICPENSTTVYAGIAAGSLFTNTGGSSTTICLPEEPIFGNHYIGGSASPIYGTEYEDTAAETAAIFGRDVAEDDVPCVVCEATGRRSKMLVPARNVCYSGWHLEYSGYLMTSHDTHQRTNMQCVDHNPDVVNGQSGSNSGNHFCFVEAEGQIPDPPYTRDKELTCAICTK